MDIDTLIRFTTQGMLLCMYVSLPIVIVAAAVGLAVSFVQAITSMQDQALSHGVKLTAVTIAIVILAPFSAAAVLRFANEVLQVAVPRCYAPQNPSLPHKRQISRDGVPISTLVHQARQRKPPGSFAAW